MEPGPFPLSLMVVTRDEEANLRRCLRSAAPLAREIIVVDSGSTDGTVDVACEFGAVVHHQEWLGFRDQKRFAFGLCREDWVLLLDADEEISPELRGSINAFFQRDAGRFEAAEFARKVWFLGRWITHGDWYPDVKTRLVRRSRAEVGGDPTHERFIVEGETVMLRGDLHHYSFPSTNVFVRKINDFADEQLKNDIESGRRWSLLHNLFRPWWRFVRCYIVKGGFLDGFPGLWIAVGIAFGTFVRHSRTYEAAAAPEPERMAGEGGRS